MELALITAQQVAVLFLLIGTGMVAVKTGVLKLENKQALSNLLVYIIVPAMVVNSYRMEFSAQILRNLLAAFGMSVLSVLLGTVITLLLTARKTGSRMPIFRFACIFSNAAYMGFPLISALFGSEGLLYASAYVTVFNILLWTLGYGLVSGGSSVKEVARSLVRTPVLYAIVVGLGIYLLQIPLPALITQPLELLAGVNTPLSMLITGMLIAAGDVRTIVTDKHIWRLASVRMLLIPAATLALFGVLGFHGTAAQVVTLLECCPAAAITSVFAVQFGHDEHFAAGSVVLTTLLSIVTLPLCALIITMVTQTLPTAVFMLKSYFDTIPDEIEEAAMMDGLNRLQIIFRITVPLAMSGLISVFVYCFMVAWNDYLFASIFLSSASNFTLPVGLNALFSTPDYIWGRMMAASLVTALPVVIMYALSERFIKSGLTAGGVKG